MTNLNTLLEDTMLFVANGGAPPRELAPPPAHAKITAFGTKPPGDKITEDTCLWSWKFDSAHPARVTDVSCNTAMMAGMKVCERIEWECLSVTFGGATRALPLTQNFLGKIYHLTSGSIAEDASIYWKLESKLDASHLLVFGYQFSSSKAQAPTPIPKQAWLHSDLMSAVVSSSGKMNIEVPLNGSTSFTIVPRRVIVCLSLACCKMRYDWDPAGALGAARIYPHLMVMTNFNLDASKGERIDTTLHMERPSKTCHAGPDMDASISSALVTDTNHQRNNFSWDWIEWLENKTGAETTLPYWDNIFDYYLTPSQPMQFIAVDPDSRERTISGALKYHNGRPGDIRKAARQGEFDNLHLAPAMRIPEGCEPVVLKNPKDASTLGFTKIAMAPFCIHDCLHTHWRWGDGYLAKKNLGWSDAGPYTAAGAPLVPPNQRVTVSLDGSSFRTEVSIVKNVVAGQWQIVNHHGSAYAVDWGFQARAALELLAGPLVFWAACNKEVPLPWWAMYWMMRYDVNLDLMVLSSDYGRVEGCTERIQILDLSAAQG